MISKHSDCELANVRGVHFYRPQRSWGKVIFSQACVKNSVHRGLPEQTPLGRHPPGQAPPGQVPPHGQAPPPGQAQPPGQAPPPLAGTPPIRHHHPSNGQAPIRQTPSLGRHPQAVHAGMRPTHRRYAFYWNAVLFASV